MTPIFEPRLPTGMGPPYRRCTCPCARGTQVPHVGGAKKAQARRQCSSLCTQIAAQKMGSRPKARFLRRPLDITKTTPLFDSMANPPLATRGRPPRGKARRGFSKLWNHFMDPACGVAPQLAPTPWHPEWGPWHLRVFRIAGRIAGSLQARPQRAPRTQTAPPISISAPEIIP